jgi:hypothetical protein
MRVIHLHAVVKAVKLSIMCINFTPLNTSRGAREKSKKYGANAPQLHPIWTQAASGDILQHLFPLSVLDGEGARG